MSALILTLCLIAALALLLLWCVVVFFAVRLLLELTGVWRP